MKKVCPAAVVAAALVVGHLHLTAAESVKLRFLAAVYADEKGGGFKQPEGLACDATGRLVVGDTGNDRIVRFTFVDGKLAGGTEVKIPEVSAPSRVQLSSKGDIYVLDAKRRRIAHLGPAGEFKEVVSLEGAPATGAFVLKSFTLDAADNIYVLDVFSNRVVVLDAAGQFQKALPLPADAAFVSDLSVDARGNILALDSIGRRIYSAGKDATSFAPFGGELAGSLVSLPTSITAARTAFLVAEGSGGTIASLGRDGAFLSHQLTPGWKEGSLNHPSQICVNDKDQAFVADRDNSRVQVFALR